jgi:DNA-binding HxlR family transcriptional regulator
MAATTEARGNVCSEMCGSRQVLDLIADKWAVIVIYVLAAGTRRFGELQRSVGGVSQKMLTQTLRGLERDGLVDRKVYPVIPPRVEYSLSPLGETLVEPLSALCRWAEEHYWEVERERGTRAEPATA